MAKPKVAAFRIAMRTLEDAEGYEWWVAVLARIENMNDTLEIARVRRSAIAKSPKVRQAFIDFCTLAMNDRLSDLGITAGEWQQQKPLPPSQGRG